MSCCRVGLKEVSSVWHTKWKHERFLFLRAERVVAEGTVRRSLEAGAMTHLISTLDCSVLDTRLQHAFTPRVAPDVTALHNTSFIKARARSEENWLLFLEPSADLHLCVDDPMREHVHVLPGSSLVIIGQYSEKMTASVRTSAQYLTLWPFS